MAFGDEFVCTKVRFTFFNGQRRYTVQYSPALRMWFVFEEDKEQDCLAKYDMTKGMRVRFKCDLEQAAYFLNKYFESIKSDFYA